MAKIISISVPDNLFTKLKGNKEFSVSAVCQGALRERLAGVDELARLGAERLRKERWSKWELLCQRCHAAGCEWAAKRATVEELEEVFKSRGKQLKKRSKKLEEGGLREIFIKESQGFVPDECFKEDIDNELLRAFAEGARDVWSKIKTLLGR